MNANEISGFECIVPITAVISLLYRHYDFKPASKITGDLIFSNDMRNYQPDCFL
jgi:hypothetical protein